MGDLNRGCTLPGKSAPADGCRRLVSGPPTLRPRLDGLRSPTELVGVLRPNTESLADAVPVGASISGVSTPPPPPSATVRSTAVRLVDSDGSATRRQFPLRTDNAYKRGPSVTFPDQPLISNAISSMLSSPSTTALYYYPAGGGPCHVVRKTVTPCHAISIDQPH
ncbi:hypothetical protein BRADI_3g26275v3 [Brachypodium distachyon]|uniref:Uncharacterized protein n=1 Tax=Brachypodium distachyon TaxID=15368 RepID=A0A0Q3LWF9_BRADI|nr:hypothetical protein BRADI_3g26275v3 [Brachypodium distachyon]